ncbi:hypothetical protein B0T19DRAFT_415951, partial [Cercophora scortea]
MAGNGGREKCLDIAEGTGRARATTKEMGHYTMVRCLEFNMVFVFIVWVGHGRGRYYCIMVIIALIIAGIRASWVQLSFCYFGKREIYILAMASFLSGAVVGLFVCFASGGHDEMIYLPCVFVQTRIWRL